MSDRSELPLLDFSLQKLNRLTHRFHSLPLVVLMPHSRCNCRCVMCDIWKANSDRRELSLEDLQPHLDQFRRLRVRWVVFSGGEALMYGSLWPLCEQLEALGIRKTLLSTGLLLSRDAEPVSRWIDEVIVSLDGPQEVHDSIRRIAGGFQKLAAGVEAVRAHGPAKPVAGRCVIQRANWNSLAETVDTARELGLDSISFLAADVSSEAFNRSLRPWDDERVAEIALTADEGRELLAMIDRLVQERNRDFESGFIVESPDKLRNIARYSLALAGEGDLPKVRCNAPWVSTVIEADGAVKPCFFHPSYGNLHEQELVEILESAKAREFRRRLDVGEDPICRRCVCSLNL